MTEPAVLTEVYLPIVDMSGRTMRGAGDTYGRPDIRQAAGVQTWYNWGPAPGGDGIPMLWSGAHIGAQLSGDATWLMGFNEPDIAGQANMTPEAAALAWATVEQTYPDRKLVSPGVMSLTWLINWRAAYYTAYGQAPKVDAVGVHWYYQADGNPLQSFKCQVQLAENLAQQWGVAEVWVTEFAYYPCWSDTATAAQFVRDAFTWLDTRPMVTRAFWFQTFWYNDGRDSERDWAPPQDCYSGLGLDDGSLTSIGEAFLEMSGNGGVNPNWDEASDLNKDGRVDILDLSRVAAHYGERKT